MTVKLEKFAKRYKSKEPVLLGIAKINEGIANFDRIVEVDEVIKENGIMKIAVSMVDSRHYEGDVFLRDSDTIRLSQFTYLVLVADGEISRVLIEDQDQGVK